MSKLEPTLELLAHRRLLIFAQHLGPEIHNRALEQAKKAIQTKLADLEVDIDILRVSS